MKYLYFLSLLLSSSYLHSQGPYTLSGYVEDLSTGERLISATLYDFATERGTVTNEYGFFSLTLPAQKSDLRISYVGYQDQRLSITPTQDSSLTIRLSPSLQLQEIEIVAEKQVAQHKETQMSQVAVPIEQIKAMPVILGEEDILKALQLLPGVSPGGEGQTGVYVRGGSPDQNLVLLDGVPVYNVSHLLGLFSVFNPDAIKNVTLTKGGFPARFGGRLSSVIDIRMKEGNLNEFSGEGSIGLISSKLTLQGPINQGKTSFLLSGRRTYADLIAKPFIKVEGDAQKPKFHFYDLNMKLQHKLNDKHRLYLSGYLGDDIFQFEERSNYEANDAGTDWGNSIAALRWNWELNPKMFLNTTINYSNYDINIFASNEEFLTNTNQDPNSFAASYISGIQDWSAKMDLDYVPNSNHYIKAGISGIRHVYKPGALTVESVSSREKLDTLIGQASIKSYEYDAYIEDNISLGDLSINAGLHASLFSVDGQTYQSLQPRLGLQYSINDKWSLKASYSQMTQYINLLTSESLSLPTDLWVPSTANIKPQQSKQVALGISTGILKDIDLSLEGYYKKMDNVISYKEGANFLFGFEDDWESKLTQGSGESYGIELLAQKKFGRLSGWIGYTLSWNWRQFDDINGGDRFPFRYDRRHDLSIVGTYKLGKKVTLSANWSYGTGNAVTLGETYIPTNYYSDPRYEVAPQIYGTYSSDQKNNYRMSSYHRLDLSVRLHKKKKNGERAWVFGLYNAYGNKNPFFIRGENNYEYNEQTNDYEFKGRQFKEISLLRFIPSISYQFKF